MHDIRFGLRRLHKSLGFTAVAAFTLALGIGANTANFSLVSGILLRPLPYPSPSELVSCRGQLYGVSPIDAVTYISVSVMAASVTLAACYIPARRAMDIDPLTALRYD